MFDKMFSDFCYWGVGTAFSFYDGLMQYAERQRKIWGEPWARLTRPLKPTPEQEAYNLELAQHVAIVTRLNQETNHYNYKTWWAEYHQARKLNVN